MRLQWLVQAIAAIGINKEAGDQIEISCSYQGNYIGRYRLVKSLSIIIIQLFQRQKVLAKKTKIYSCLLAANVYYQRVMAIFTVGCLLQRTTRRLPPK